MGRLEKADLIVIVQSPRRDAGDRGKVFYCEHSVSINYNVTLMSRVLSDKGYGLADRQEGTPNTIQTRFHLFNASKAFTAIGILAVTRHGLDILNVAHEGENIGVIV